MKAPGLQPAPTCRLSVIVFPPSALRIKESKSRQLRGVSESPWRRRRRCQAPGNRCLTKPLDNALRSRAVGERGHDLRGEVRHSPPFPLLFSALLIAFLCHPPGIGIKAMGGGGTSSCRRKWCALKTRFFRCCALKTLQLPSLQGDEDPILACSSTGKLQEMVVLAILEHN